MDTRTGLRPKASGLTPYQQKIKRALDQIAAIEPAAGDCVSETALLVATATPGDVKDYRDTLRVAFELAADRGYARREYLHWRFKRRFTAADVVDLIAWRGKWQAPERAEAHTSKR